MSKGRFGLTVGLAAWETHDLSNEGEIFIQPVPDRDF